MSDKWEGVVMFGMMTRRERRLLTLYEKTVQQMEPLDRAIFLAHRVDDVSLCEIARRNGLTITQVEQAVMRCLAIIHRVVGDEVKS